MTNEQKRQAEAHDKISAAVKFAGKQAGYATQIELAKLIKITPAYLSDIMSRRRQWGPQRLKLMAKKLNVDGREWQRLGAAAAGWEF